MEIVLGTDVPDRARHPEPHPAYPSTVRCVAYLRVSMIDHACECSFSDWQTIDTQGPFGRFFVQVIAAFAELESGIIGERVCHGMREKARQGGFNGMSPPFGYDIADGGLVINEREAVVVRRICRWKRGGKSFAWIARKLNTGNVPTKKGKRWTERQIFRIVHNPLHRGNLHWADVLSPGTHPVIVTWTPGRKGRKS